MADTTTPKPGSAGNSPTAATRHACTRCGHSGDYSGPGPHTCPGCDERLRELPAGHTTERGPLSCWVTIKSKRGAWLAERYFDVPSEDYSTGRVTGARLALELVQMVRAATPEEQPRMQGDIEETVRAAGLARKNGRMPSRAGAAAAFSATMFAILIGGIRHLSAAEFAQEIIETEVKSLGFVRGLEAEERAGVVARMAAARAARRQHRQRRAVAALSAALHAGVACPQCGGDDCGAVGGRA